MTIKGIISILAGLFISLGASACHRDTPPGKEDETPVNPPLQQKKDISILAIGNSFSVDGMQYLFHILKDAGAEEVVLGNLYIGGCTLEKHAGNFASNSAAYTYYKNTAGEWTSTASFKPLDALDEREWDIITLQQASGQSGVQGSYSPYLDNLLAILKEHCPKSRLYWHMTWAYQGNSTHSAFPNYGSSQATMYSAILSAVKDVVLQRADFEGIIPSGTAIQNIRTSLYGDNVTRDGYHLSYDVGRFTASLVWAGALFGADIEKITWHPTQYSYTQTQLDAIREAAANAVKEPFKVTESSYPPDPDAQAETLEDYIRAAGMNPQDYTQKDISWTKFAYYNSGNGTMLSTMYTHENSTQSNLDEFVTTPIYGRDEIPEGSLIVIKAGYQYRPEGWVTLSTRNSSRPGLVTAAGVQPVTASWWGNWQYRAFNVSRNPREKFTDATADEACAAFGIFIPNEL